MNLVTSSDSIGLDCDRCGVTCRTQAALPAQNVAYHTHIEINLIKHGSLTYLCGEKKIRLGRGRLVAFWSAIPHQIIAADKDAEYFEMTIPLTWFLQCQLPETFTHLILNGQVVVDPEECSRVDFAMFDRWCDELRRQQPVRQRMVLLEVEARLLRLALGLAVQEHHQSGEGSFPVTRGNENVDRIRKMLCFIAQNYTEQITVELISRSVGFHPNYAMNVFRKTFGTTLVNYVTRHRVTHAQRLLATTDQKIVDVALSSGFNSLSRFNDAFKKACACSPREYRDRQRTVSLN